MTAAHHTVESIATEIERIVSDRQALRTRGAGADELERNRVLLASSQTLFSKLLVERYLPQAAAA